MEKGSKVVQIGSIHMSHLTNDAHFMYMKDVVDAMEADGAAQEVEKIMSAVGRLRAALEEEDKCFMLSRTSRYTALVREKDKERDAILRGYRTAVKGLWRMPVKASAEAADVLWQHLKDYRIDTRMQLERETARIMNLVDDLLGRYAVEVGRLGLQPYVDALKEANDMVSELLSKRIDERSRQTVGAMRKARRATDEAYLDAVRMINAFAVIGTTKDLTKLISFLNAGIKRYKEQVMRRRNKDAPTPAGAKDTAAGEENH